MKQVFLMNSNLEMSELGKEQLVSNSYYSWAPVDKSVFLLRTKIRVDDSQGIKASSIQATISGNISSSTSLILLCCRAVGNLIGGFHNQVILVLS